MIAQSSIESNALQIYEAYPKKVGKPKALWEIKKQLQRIEFSFLLAATKGFAEAWKNETDLTFCPYPSTWFHQERFNDSPETWKPHGNIPGQKPTSIMDLKSSLQIKEQKAYVLKAKNTFEDAMGVKWLNLEARADYLKLRNEIKGLQVRIEEMV